MQDELNMNKLGPFILQLLQGAPIGFIDVGARGGVHPLIEPIAQAVAVLGFEPDEMECARILTDKSAHARFPRLELEPIAISDRSGSATLHHISAPTNTSLRPTNPVFVDRYNMIKWHEVGRSSIVTTTLDAILYDKRSDESMWGEAIKLDTQGTEFEVLLGADKTLAERTQFLCIEVSLCELYVGQRLFSDIESMLRAKGFSFYGFDRIFNRSRKSLNKRTHWGRERIIQADAYFFKDPFDKLSQNPPSVDRRQLIILATFATMTGYYDFALEILEEIGEAASEFREAVVQLARLSTEASVRDVGLLWDAVRANPKDANVQVGKFVDNRRFRNDYFDIP